MLTLFRINWQAEDQALKALVYEVWSRPGQAIPKPVGAWRGGKSPLMGVL